MKLLDLFCGAGGAAVGYHRAGFDVTGVDNRPQPRYPFILVQADALEYVMEHGGDYDVIHASPPCQGYSRTHAIHRHETVHPMLVESVRDALQATGRPYVIENVPGAPLHGPIILCGMFFGLNVYRHRLFEANVHICQPEHHHHIRPATKVGRRPVSGEVMCVAGHFSGVRHAAGAMGITHRMTQYELAQSIPPAYTEYVGRQILEYLR